MFFHDSGREDIPAVQDGFAFGMELTQGGIRYVIPGRKPLFRLAGLLHSASRRWKAAATPCRPGPAAASAARAALCPAGRRNWLDRTPGHCCSPTKQEISVEMLDGKPKTYFIG
jgi:hypothetical protein